jgi:SAM-dependent methyltransferase
MWEVIEHLRTPRDTLREIGRVLRPNGTLILSTPDAGSLVARLAGTRWLGWKKVPEHLSFFDRAALTRLLDSEGFRVERQTYLPLVVSWSYALDRASAMVGFRLRAPAWLSHRSVRVNPYYDLCIVARKNAPLTPGGAKRLRAEAE